MHLLTRRRAISGMTLAALVAAGCASDGEAAFPVDYQKTYTKIADCKKSGSHTEGPYVESWISPGGLAAR